MMRLSSGGNAIFLPAFGALLGAFGALVYTSARVFPSVTVAILFAVFWGAFVPRESQRLNLRWGMISVVTMAARALLILHFATPRTADVLIAAQAIPRSAWIALAWLSRPAPSGAGFEFSSTLVSWEALAAIAEGVAAALWLGLRPAAMIVAGAYLIARLVQWISYRYKGGVNGDSFGAMQLLTELYVLFLFDCAACRW